MIQDSLAATEQQLQTIVNRLLLNGTLVNDPGLLHGKTGIAVFFFHHAAHTGNLLFEEYAGELIAGVQAQIHTATPVDYENGIAGIGAGVEYLIRTGFLEPEGNTVFNDFDARMYRAAMYEPYPDLSLQDGLAGWGRYFIYRLQSCIQANAAENRKALARILRETERKMQEEGLNETEQTDVYCFLQDATALPGFSEQATNLLHRCREWESIRQPDMQKIFFRLGGSFAGNMARLHLCRKYFGIAKQATQGQADRTADTVTGMGLLTGCAGEGMTSLCPNDDAWLNLL